MNNVQDTTTLSVIPLTPKSDSIQEIFSRYFQKDPNKGRHLNLNFAFERYWGPAHQFGGSQLAQLRPQHHLSDSPDKPINTALAHDNVDAQAGSVSSAAGGSVNNWLIFGRPMHNIRYKFGKFGLDLFGWNNFYGSSDKYHGSKDIPIFP